MILEEGTDAQMKFCIEKAMLPLPGEHWQYQYRDQKGTLSQMALYVWRVGPYWAYGNLDIEMRDWPRLVGEGRLKLIA